MIRVLGPVQVDRPGRGPALGRLQGSLPPPRSPPPPPLPPLRAFAPGFPKFKFPARPTCRSRRIPAAGAGRGDVPQRHTGGAELAGPSGVVGA
jgi:hypothetical protein